MSDQLTKIDWLEQGLKTLGQDGAAGLKADLLARALGVSRGSFYWHFKDVEMYRLAVLDHWRLRMTQNVIDFIDDRGRDTSRLSVLLARALRSDMRLERAVRAWATSHPQVAGAVDTVDKQRIAYVVELLRAEGVSPEHAAKRGRFLYWAFLGQAAMCDPSQDRFGDADIADIVHLILG